MDHHQLTVDCLRNRCQQPVPDVGLWPTDLGAAATRRFSPMSMPAIVDAGDRKANRPREHFGEYAGILQVDGYSSYAALAKRRQQVRLAFCWARVRRKFDELTSSPPVATEVMRRIAELYAMEDRTRGEVAEKRRALRAEHSRPIVDELPQYPKTHNRLVRNFQCSAVDRRLPP